MSLKRWCLIQKFQYFDPWSQNVWSWSMWLLPSITISRSLISITSLWSLISRTMSLCFSCTHFSWRISTTDWVYVSVSTSFFNFAAFLVWNKRLWNLKKMNKDIKTLICYFMRETHGFFLSLFFSFFSFLFGRTHPEWCRAEGWNCIGHFWLYLAGTDIYIWLKLTYAN